MMFKSTIVYEISEDDTIKIRFDIHELKNKQIRNISTQEYDSQPRTDKCRNRSIKNGFWNANPDPIQSQALPAAGGLSNLLLQQGNNCNGNFMNIKSHQDLQASISTNHGEMVPCSQGQLYSYPGLTGHCGHCGHSGQHMNHFNQSTFSQQFSSLINPIKNI